MEKIFVIRNNMVNEINTFLSEHPESHIESVTRVSDAVVYIVVKYRLKNIENEGSTSTWST